MDPCTGEVLAMANEPTFDPNRYWKFTDDAAARPGDHGRLRAGLDVQTRNRGCSARVAAKSHWQRASRRTTAGSRRANDSQRGRWLHGRHRRQRNAGPNHRVLAQRRRGRGRNVRSAPKRFTTWNAKRASAILPAWDCRARIPESCRAPKDWSAPSLATMSFGQGVSVTPMAMARYYSAIANGGLLMQPRIVRAVYDEQGKKIAASRRTSSAEFFRSGRPRSCAAFCARGPARNR